MKKITVLSIVFLFVGGISAILIGYEYFTSVHVISKQQAIDLAMKYGQWTQQTLGNDTIDAKLLQAKMSNSVALVLNDTTMSYESHAVPLIPRYVKNDQMFWQVIIKHYLSKYEFKTWIYEIDAMNGTRIESIG